MSCWGGGGYDSVLCIFIFIYNTVSGISEYPLIQKTKRQERSRNDFSTFFPSVLKLPTVCILFCVRLFFIFMSPPPFHDLLLCATHISLEILMGI
jgi:hypothetical protein